MLPVKIVYNGDMRRFRLDDLNGKDGIYKKLEEHIIKSYNDLVKGNFVCKYVDDDEDEISISSDIELEEAVRFFKDLGKLTVKLSISKINVKKPIVVAKKPEKPVEKPQEPEEKEPAFTFKVAFDGKDYTIIVEKLPLTIDHLNKLLKDKLKINNFSIRYLDDEDEEVTMVLQRELDEALQIAVDKTLKLVVQAVKEKEDFTWAEFNQKNQQLIEMGYGDSMKNTQLLQEFNCDLNKVIEQYQKK